MAKTDLQIIIGYCEVRLNIFIMFRKYNGESYSQKNKIIIV